ncbi:MAG: ATP-binding cassette domain-containing protein, partial [Bacteroidales bacterium]|nr:ATP-binding cassette domain-containing protein [Bacteroidales bacterium]
TLMRVFMGVVAPETGNVVIPSDRTVGYLPQEMPLTSSKAVMEETLTAFFEVNRVEEKIQKLSLEIQNREDYESESYLKLIHQLDEANHQFQVLGGHTRLADAEKVLLGLGFSTNDFQRPMASFSGGWQMRVELAKILLRRPALLLLDEPTNHLDIESIQWLESFLIPYPGAVMVISHDRAFLDNLCKRTIEISNKKIYDYKANYTEYVELRAERFEQELAAYTNQQKQIAQTERFIERFRAKATKAKQVQSRVKLLEKIDRIEVDNIDNSAIHFRFPPAPQSGKLVVTAEGVCKTYPQKTVLKNLDFVINKGDRVAFVGKNGEGKTTLSRIILDLLDYEGKITLGHNVITGYFAQNQTELLDGEKTVFETLDHIAVGDVRTRIRNILGGFLFGGDAIDKKVKVLSGGEKTRLALAGLLLSPINLLVLDEPTNHLDMRSKDILKSALLQFDGTLIIVSHDRDFLQGLSNRVFEFKNQQIREYLGDIYDFIEARQLESLKDLESPALKQKNEKSQSVSESKEQWEKKKLIEKEARRLKTLIEKCESKHAELEKELEKLSSQLSNPENPTETDYKALYEKHTRIKEEINKTTEEWESLHLQIDSLSEDK